MGSLESAVHGIEEASVPLDRFDDRTEFDSIVASLVEMTDTVAGELADLSEELMG